MDDYRGIDFTKYKDKISKKSNELYQIGKLNLNISHAYSELDELYQKLGELVYTKRITQVDQSQEALQLLQAITDQRHEITKLEKKVELVKQDRICPNCQQRLSSKEKYCPNCFATMRE